MQNIFLSLFPSLSISSIYYTHMCQQHVCDLNTPISIYLSIYIYTSRAGEPAGFHQFIAMRVFVLSRNINDYETSFDTI